MGKGYRQQLPDRDPQETEEWIDSIASIIDIKGEERARYLLQTLIREARDRNIAIPPLTNSPYVNTIPPESEPDYPGDEILEKLYEILKPLAKKHNIKINTEDRPKPVCPV